MTCAFAQRASQNFSDAVSQGGLEVRLCAAPAHVALALAGGVAAGAAAALLLPLLAGVGAVPVRTHMSTAAVASLMRTFLFSHIDLLSLTLRSRRHVPLLAGPGGRGLDCRTVTACRPFRLHSLLRSRLP